MSTSTVDAKKRIVLPSGKPGEVYDLQRQDDSHWLLVRLERPEHSEHVSRKDCLAAMRRAPLRPRMDWKKLRRLTRDA